MAAPRIIAGTYRGRRLVVPAGDRVRPTKDRVKEAVFSALDARGLLADAVVVDLYAGSGALGLEALSRGAAEVTFVERDRAALAALRQNVAAIGDPPSVHVAASDARAWLRGGRATADLVLADPPYDLAPADRDAVIDAACRRAPGGTVVVETSASGGAPAPPDGWTVGWERRFGDTLVVFLSSGSACGAAP
jgi:16S rRNA (guanine966-N2)-methyltransferase